MTKKSEMDDQFDEFMKSLEDVGEGEIGEKLKELKDTIERKVKRDVGEQLEKAPIDEIRRQIFNQIVEHLADSGGEFCRMLIAMKIMDPFLDARTLFRKHALLELEVLKMIDMKDLPESDDEAVEAMVTGAMRKFDEAVAEHLDPDHGPCILSEYRRRTVEEWDDVLDEGGGEPC